MGNDLFRPGKPGHLSLKGKAEETRLVWDGGMEALVCEKCGEALYWNFGFRRCPYCHRKITETQKRGATSTQGHTGVIAR